MLTLTSLMIQYGQNERFGEKLLMLNDDNCQRGKQTSCLSLLD